MVMVSAFSSDAAGPARRANQFDRFRGVHVAHSASNSAKTRARKGEFREPIQADLGCRFSTPKYFTF
jgi:hypothetical protein